MRMLVVASLIMVALAGCAGDGEFENSPGGQSASGNGSLAYNGAQAGSHTDDFACDGSGKVSWSANLGGGTLRVQVLDDNGIKIYDESYSGPGQKSASSDVSGNGGEWTIRAERGGGFFSGQYSISVRC